MAQRPSDDYGELPETFRTAGFYKRESSIANLLLAQESRHGIAG